MPRVSIDAITIQNASVISERILKKNCFSAVKRSTYFDQDALSGALELLVEFYLRHGFLHITIIGHEFVPLAKQGSYTLVVTIDEGVRTCMETVSIPDFPEIEKKGPFIRMGKKNNAVPFDERHIFGGDAHGPAKLDKHVGKVEKMQEIMHNSQSDEQDVHYLDDEVHQTKVINRAFPRMNVYLATWGYVPANWSKEIERTSVMPLRLEDFSRHLLNNR